MQALEEQGYGPEFFAQLVDHTYDLCKEIDSAENDLQLTMALAHLKVHVTVYGHIMKVTEALPMQVIAADELLPLAEMQKEFIENAKNLVLEDGTRAIDDPSVIDVIPKLEAEYVFNKESLQPYVDDEPDVLSDMAKKANEKKQKPSWATMTNDQIDKLHADAKRAVRDAEKANPSRKAD